MVPLASCGLFPRGPRYRTYRQQREGEICVLHVCIDWYSTRTHTEESPREKEWKIDVCAPQKNWLAVVCIPVIFLCIQLVSNRFMLPVVSYSTVQYNCCHFTTDSSAACRRRRRSRRRRCRRSLPTDDQQTRLHTGTHYVPRPICVCPINSPCRIHARADLFSLCLLSLSVSCFSLFLSLATRSFVCPRETTVVPRHLYADSVVQYYARQTRRPRHFET